MAKPNTQRRLSGAEHYLQPAFLICAAVLALAGGGMSIAIKTLGVYLKKEPLSLRKSLELLDVNGLSFYTVGPNNKFKIDNQEVIKSLGTKDYIQWVLEDTTVPEDSPIRKCSLFITYYDLPDKVPHVPEECYTGGGNQRMDSDGLTLKVSKDSTEISIPVKYLLFASTNNTEFPVLYVFSVNGRYKSGREGVRRTLNENILGKYSYFSKVEWKFFNLKYGRMIYPGKEQAIEASRKLLGTILPILESEHWPADRW